MPRPAEKSERADKADRVGNVEKRHAHDAWGEQKTSIFYETFRQRLLVEDFSDILGQDTVKQDLKSALYMERHVILVGPPGVGKTTLAKNVAELLPDIEVEIDEGEGGKKKKAIRKGTERFVRVQGSPDLTAEDLLGDIDPIKALKFGALSKEAFTPGKIFKADKGVLFFDEVNRCSEKLQNALLQVLEEGKITIGAYIVDFDAEFIFIGTMNPEDTSTEPLSDVFLDRFDLIHISYPENLAIEETIVKMKGKRIMKFPDDLLSETLMFIRQLRSDQNVEKKPSVRASLGVYERAQSIALFNSRDEVTQEDINAVLVSVIAHRIKLKPSVRYIEAPEKYIEGSYQRFLRNRELQKDSDVP